MRRGRHDVPRIRFWVPHFSRLLREVGIFSLDAAKNPHFSQRTREMGHPGFD
jgi:hypothetical protein